MDKIKKWQQITKDFLVSSFRILTITLFTLLLPLSFLLLARLCFAHYLIDQSSFLFSFIFHTNPALLYTLISIITISTLINVLISESADSMYRPRLHIAWGILCLLQVCVYPGLEGTISAGINGRMDVIIIGKERSFISKTIFFLGLHEITLLFCRAIVKPIVDDTMFGDCCREERLIERVVLGASFGLLWWCRMREEMDVLVAVAESREDGVDVADFISWWLYYLTRTIGMVRIVKSLISVGKVLVFERVRNDGSCFDEVDDDKV